MAAGRQILSSYTHLHSKISFAIFLMCLCHSELVIVCWLVCFFGMCMGASNSVAILLSLTSVNGKVCYDEISVLDKICCVIVFGFMLFRKGIGCYFFFFFL